MLFKLDERPKMSTKNYFSASCDCRTVFGTTPTEQLSTLHLHVLIVIINNVFYL